MSKAMNAEKEISRKPLRSARQKRLAKRVKKSTPRALPGARRHRDEPERRALSRRRRDPARGTVPR
ncbi:TPA: hypothetical protein L6B08_09620 [Pseudomonas aeruginosa]|nr:hypothetical protein [Pseudomonas aeruginosa]HBP6375246.1 hypothetical protein [Pseudomonas aeruginosa]HBP6459517.1 hypothetical protein [Pseudomonas aeruginosa]HBP6820166.1 hypothetical protein [Pseudomonas aeruginosa]HBP6843774.1 hypothetical protein [Pseudomonas aeruginosa]